MDTGQSKLKTSKQFLPLLLIIAGLLLSFRHPLTGLVSPVQLDMKIEHQPAIMPALYKVYSNENALYGKYSLFKMLVTNNSNRSARDVDVSFQIPNYIEWTSVMKIPSLEPGQSAVVNCYPSFADKIVEKTTTSEEKVNIKIKGANISDIDQSFAIEIQGRNDFLYTCVPANEIRTSADVFDNANLLTCFVTPEDPIIKYYTQKIQEKILKGETAAVGNKEEEGVRFMEGIYLATLMSHMVYSGTSGVPERLDDITTMHQSIRLPREVVTGKTGLCIELSLLYASIMADAGMNPVIYFIPGHAYPGFKMNGHYYAIESTGIGGEGIGGSMNTDEAYREGMKNLQTFFQAVAAGDDRYQLLDVRDAINKGAVAMELKDDSFLRQKIDEITQVFDANYGSGSGNDATGYNLYQDAVSFSYPNTWIPAPRSSESMPQMKQLIADKSNMASVIVYQFDGYTDPEQAIVTIKQYAESYQGTSQYTNTGQAYNGYSLFNGQTTYSNGNAFNWTAALKATGSGVVGIAVAAYTTADPKYQSILLDILKSLR
ncbi:hypothetical protein [Flavisolibacter ginsenosidimutans]|uniref:Transglutaminase domain-containing protein n=1 Tax=Flavisolibacter ginsenosidimutans TaxID=661481 RepID=A0A5B8UHI0_9BACT|nr:hypothetical protein [Flavisolibacter ginsenosidimutans]QEC56094.1 hypothetical protein FSB75_09370 [Flavisolibacter ginsenosidimutans]